MVLHLCYKIFGFTFGLKLMEKGEKLAQKGYREILNKFPEVKEIVLGLSDALVELTGTLAGLTLIFALFLVLLL
jgi:hemoglobin-like flavoprotein